MSRRKVLVGGAAAIAAAACDRNGERGAATTTGGPTSGSSGVSSEIEISPLRPQLEASPIAFGKGRIGHLRHGEDTLMVVKTDGVSVELSLPIDGPRGIGVSEAGALVVVEAGKLEGLAVLVPGAASLMRVSGPLLLDSRRDSRVFAAGPDRVVVASYRSSKHDPKGPFVELLDFSKSELSSQSAITLRLGNDFDSLCQLDGGALAYADSSGIVRVNFAGQHEKLGGPSSITALAAGPSADHVWVADSEKGLVLFSLANASAVAGATFAGRVYHLGSHGDRVAAILVNGDLRNPQAELALFDINASPLWRIPLVISGAINHWVALSSSHVAVATPTALTLHDAATGETLASV